MKKVTFLSILMIMFLTIGFSPPKKASASLDEHKTYNWDTRTTFLDKEIKGQYSRYSAVFNKGSSLVKVKGKKEPIDLTETVVKNGKDTKVRRYYFWVEDFKTTTDSGTYWHTESFLATNETVGHNGYSSYDGAGGADVPRMEATNVKENKSDYFFVDDGVKDSRGYELCIYIVDVEKWVQSVWNTDAYDEYCYLQPVISLHHGGSTVASAVTNLETWYTTGWFLASRNREKYSGHYNYKIHISDNKQSTVKVHYKIWDSGDKLDTETIENLANIPGTKDKDSDNSAKTMKASEAFTLKELSPTGITNQGYYLKGIKVVAGDAEEHFYVLNDYDSSPQIVLKPKSNTITKYSKPNGTGKEKDTFAGDVMKAATSSKLAAGKHPQDHLSWSCQRFAIAIKECTQSVLKNLRAVNPLLVGKFHHPTREGNIFSHRVSIGAGTIF
jgi:hypothetical protein